MYCEFITISQHVILKTNPIIDIVLSQCCEIIRLVIYKHLKSITAIHCTLCKAKPSSDKYNIYVVTE